MTAHYFAFSRGFEGPDRLCGECGLTYDAGSHIEIATLKPYTSYVCPNAFGLPDGHVSLWTGAYRHSGRRLDEHLCTCGAELVEEDSEQWRLSWEMRRPPDPDPYWRRVTVVRSKHAAHQQYAGLLALIGQGEPIRHVTLQKEGR